MTEWHVWATALAGGLVLPVSFFSLSLSSRYTHPSNVSLLMLLETVLGPIWIWAGTGIQPTPSRLGGGVIVIVSLALYLGHTGRRQVLARQADLVKLHGRIDSIDGLSA